MHYLKIVPVLLATVSISLLADDLVTFSLAKKPLLPNLALVIPKKSTLILPQNAADADELAKQQMTYLSPTKGVSKDAAWSILKTYLELSGYSVAQKNKRLTVVRNKSISGGAINREVIPVYAGILPSNLLPDDTRIRYIHYLRNLTVPTLDQKDSHPLSKMLLEMLSPDALLLFDSASNAIIMTDKTSHLISIAHLLNEFESRGLKEEVAYIPLKYIASKELETILTSLKIAAQDSQGRKFIRSDAHADAVTLYSQDTRVVADPHRNGIVLLGRRANVERIGDFIQNSLDVPADRGDSILHFYDLQYLDATIFASILERVVSSALPEGIQATQESRQPFFKGVAIAPLVTPEKAPETQSENIIETDKGVLESTNLEITSPNSGNRLVIAARQEEWKIIHDLIKKLDQPQPQVVLEIMIVEFTYDHETAVSGTLRSKTCNPLVEDGVQFLASHITSPSNVLGSNPQQLAQDLLQVVGPNNVASQVGPGTLLLSINDPATPGILGLLSVLQRFLAAKITASPYITVINNQEGMVDSTETRRTTGDLVTTADGSFTIPIEDVNASITVKAKPRIVSDKRLRLSIGFTVEEFRGGQFDRLSRELKTTATLNSGEILAMGGLIRFDRNEQISVTPLLGYIPILGAFFRGTTLRQVRTNITLFVMPTIIQAHKHDLWRKKTRDLLCTHDISADNLLRSSDASDPIVHIFFNPHENEGTKLIDSFTRNQFDLGKHSQPKLLHLNDRTKKPLKLFDPCELRRILHQKTRPILPHWQRSVRPQLSEVDCI